MLNSQSKSSQVMSPTVAASETPALFTITLAPPNSLTTFVGVRLDGCTVSDVEVVAECFDALLCLARDGSARPTESTSGRCQLRTRPASQFDASARPIPGPGI